MYFRTIVFKITILKILYFKNRDRKLMKEKKEQYKKL